MSHVCLAAVLALALGCGRLGFDRGGLGTTDGGDDQEDGRIADGFAPMLDGAGVSDAPVGDGTAPGADGGGTTLPWIISATRLTTYSGNSWVDLEVDWARRRAYVGSREPGVCFAIFDLVDGPPRLVGRYDVAEGAPGADCLGVALSPSRAQLLVASESSGTATLFDVSSGMPVRRSSRSGLGAPRRAEFFDESTIFVALRAGGYTRLTMGPMLVPAPTAGGIACVDNNLVSAVASGSIAVVGCWPNDSPIQAIDTSGGAIARSYPMTHTSESGFWSSATSPDGTVLFVGGWVSAFFDTTVRPPRLARRMDNPSAYRDSTIVESATQQILFGARSDGNVERWDVTNPDAPVLEAVAALTGTTGEGYGIEADVASDRAVVVTNDGWLVVLVPSAFPPAPEPGYPTF